MRPFPLMIAGLAIWVSAVPAFAQGRSLDLSPPPRPSEAPYGIGRARSGFEVGPLTAGPHFAPRGPLERSSRPLQPGARAHGEKLPRCAMPVAPARGDSARMPRAAADSLRPPAPMPVAPGDCTNPLQRR